MLRNKLFFVMGLLVIASVILSACGGTAPVATEAPAVVEEAPVAATEAPVMEEPAAEQTSFTTPHPILGDLKVRQALAYCTNKADLIKSVYPLLNEEQQASLVMNTFIARADWAYAGDDKLTVY